MKKETFDKIKRLNELLNEIEELMQCGDILPMLKEESGEIVRRHIPTKKRENKFEGNATEKIIALLKEGKSAKEISEIVGCSIPTVYTTKSKNKKKAEVSEDGFKSYDPEAETEEL